MDSNYVFQTMSRVPPSKKWDSGLGQIFASITGWGGNFFQNNTHTAHPSGSSYAPVAVKQWIQFGPLQFVGINGRITKENKYNYIFYK